MRNSYVVEFKGPVNLTKDYSGQKLYSAEKRFEEEVSSNTQTWHAGSAHTTPREVRSSNKRASNKKKNELSDGSTGNARRRTGLDSLMFGNNDHNAV
jgi:hypothetical protein